MYKLIEQMEGFREVCYYCTAGKRTIGYGSTFYKDGSPIKDGDFITRAEARDLLEWYCREHIKLPKGDWNLNQKRALYSLIYNIGQPAFDKSKCKKALEAKDWKEACKQWDWNKVNGKFCKGLERRRVAEKRLFFFDIFPYLPF